MRHPQKPRNVRGSALLVAAALSVVSVFGWAANAIAQDELSTNQELIDELQKLQDRIVHLQAVLKQDHKGATAAATKERTQDASADGSAGVRIAPRYRECLQCHQTRPSGPLPASHLVASGTQPAAPGKRMGMMGKGMGMMGDSRMGMMRGEHMGGGQGMGMMSGMGGGSGMEKMQGMAGGCGGMSGMKDSQAGAEGMAGKGMMDDQMEMSAMMGMGGMGHGRQAGGAMSRMRQAAQLPGFPGASHIYHIGATDFFLDHPEHITLSTEQHAALNRLKQKALLQKSASQRKIDQGEQELWELTGSDEPDADAIEAKVEEIEKLRGAQRLAFIRSIGKAAGLLTDEQRQALLGMSEPTAGHSGAHAGHDHESNDADAR